MSKTLREIERDVILGAMRRHNGYKPAVAKELGIALKTLYNKLNRYELEVGSVPLGRSPMRLGSDEQ